MSLLVVGSVALDTIRTADGKEYPDVLGGSCTYFSVAASHLTEVRVVGVVGEDFDPKHVDLLKRHKVDLSGLETKEGGKTFRWAGTYTEDMNDRTTDDLQFGVLGGFDPVLPELYRETGYVFLACAQPELQLKVIDQMEGEPLIVSDTIEFYIENNRDALEEVLKRSHGVIVNEAEAKMLTGESNLVCATEKLLSFGPRFAVLKKGEHGGLLATADGVFPFPAYPLKDVKDPTGAGDSFAGGFMGYIASCRHTEVDHLRRAIVHGTVMASFTCSGVSLDRIDTVTEAEVSARVEHFTAMLRIPE